MCDCAPCSGKASACPVSRAPNPLAVVQSACRVKHRRWAAARNCSVASRGSAAVEKNQPRRGRPMNRSGLSRGIAVEVTTTRGCLVCSSSVTHNSWSSARKKDDPGKAGKGSAHPSLRTSAQRASSPHQATRASTLALNRLRSFVRCPPTSTRPPGERSRGRRWATSSSRVARHG